MAGQIGAPIAHQTGSGRRVLVRRAGQRETITSFKPVEMGEERETNNAKVSWLIGDIIDRETHVVLLLLLLPAACLPGEL